MTGAFIPRYWERAAKVCGQKTRKGFFHEMKSNKTMEVSAYIGALKAGAIM